MVYTHENSEMDKHLEATLSEEESQTITHDSQNMLNLFSVGGQGEDAVLVECLCYEEHLPIQKGSLWMFLELKGSSCMRKSPTTMVQVFGMHFPPLLWRQEECWRQMENK